MNLTMQSVVREIENSQDDFKGISSAMAMGSLKGARGNSGVILSQILKGFSEKTKDASEINVDVLKHAFNNSAQLAYKAVMRPKEGTILTVCKELGNAALGAKTKDVIEFFEIILEKGKIMLDKTPDMLPVLKEAGVVDSGGTGLIVIVNGMLNYLKGEDVDVDFIEEAKALNKIPKLEYDFSDEHIASKYSYCTEFLINDVKPKQNDKLRKKLEKIGDCVLVVGDDSILKIHVHTNDPNLALGYALELGYLCDIKIENMDEQRKRTKKKPDAKSQSKPKKPLALISVSVGEGFDEVFGEINVDYIVKGGQSMNPSVDDFIKAIDSVNSDNVIILPNNKNIILACEQSAKISAKNVKVVGTRSLPQGINAALVFDADKSIENNVKTMEEAMKNVHCVQVTKAVRTTNVNGIDIKEGDIIGLIDNDIKAGGNDAKEVIFKCLEDKDLKISDQAITIFYGEDTNEEEATALAKEIEEKYSDTEVDVAIGSQPLYPYIISVE